MSPFYYSNYQSILFLTSFQLPLLYWDYDDSYDGGLSLASFGISSATALPTLGISSFDCTQLFVFHLSLDFF
jgi:hypothetical protein